MANFTSSIFSTDNDNWKFKYDVTVTETTSTYYKLQFDFYVGRASNSGNQFWDYSNDMWTFSCSAAAGDKSASGTTTYRGTGYVAVNAGQFILVASKTLTLDVKLLSASTVTVSASFAKATSGSWSGKPQSSDGGDGTFTLSANAGYILTITYDSNGADMVRYEGNTISSHHTEDYEYGTYYQWGLDNGNNETHLYCERDGYHLTNCWNTKADGTGDSIDWDSYTFNAEELATRLGLDLSTGNKEATLYLEWVKDSEPTSKFSTYMRIENEWKSGSLYVKTASGWLETTDFIKL